MFRLLRRTVVLPIALVAALQLAPQLFSQTNASSARVEAIRFWSFGDVTRIAIQTQGDYKLASDQIDNPPRLYFDLTGLRPQASRKGLERIQVGDRLIRQIRIAEISPGRTRVVFDLVRPVSASASQLVNPDRLMIEVRSKQPGSLNDALIVRSATGAEQTDSQHPVAPIDGVPVRELSLAALNARPVSVGPVKQSDMANVPPPPFLSSAVRLDSPSPGVDSLVEASIRRGHLPPPSTAGRPRTTTRSEPAKPVPVAPIEASTLEADNSQFPPLPERSLRSANTQGVALPANIDSTGDRSLVRLFGLKLGKVVIDAGHGGHDTGTVGANGLIEKDLVLDVALRLGRMIDKQLGARVVYTRSEDIFIPLEDRTRIANEEKADLFISVHANSSNVANATGVETYYFNFSSDKSGLDLATRENATASSSISDLNDLLHKAVLKTKVEESREFAQMVQTSLWGMSVKMNHGSRDRGVRQAPFVVLIGATMPSILAEIGFVSNPHDASLMKRGDQRQKIADALFKGVSQYAASLSHVQIARAKSTQ